MASYGERRRHHRIGRKAAKCQQHRTYHFSKKDKQRIYVGAALVGMMLFVKGILVGMLIARD